MKYWERVLIIRSFKNIIVRFPILREKKKEPLEVLGRPGKIVSVNTHEQCCCASIITSFSLQNVHPSLRRNLSYKPTCRSNGFVSYMGQACQLTKCQTGLSRAAKDLVKPFFPFSISCLPLFFASNQRGYSNFYFLFLFKPYSSAQGKMLQGLDRQSS